MKKSMKIVTMSEYHSSVSSPKNQLSTPRKALVQGTLDIVSPRSPVQSYDSPAAVSSSSSLVSSRHSFAEDHHATPRRTRPPNLSMHSPPQPEQPSTSLDLSDEDAESASVRPFADASNVPRGRAETAPETETVGEDEEDDVAAPFSVSLVDAASALEEEENRSSGNPADPVFKPPRSIKPALEVSKSSDSGGRPKSGSSVAPGTKKKKKSARVVESRYMQMDNSRKLSNSFSVSSMGMPLLNSTSLDCSHQSAASNESHTSTRFVKRPTETKSAAPSADKTKRPSMKTKKPASASASASTSITRSDAAPSASVVRRLADAAPAAGSTAESQEELDYLHTLYIQYKFYNALLKNHDERQQRQFEAEFSVVWDAYRSRREKVADLKRELTYWEHIHSLEENITEQISLLEPLLDAFPDFSQRFSVLTEALDSTRHQLPLKDIVLPSPGRVREWQAEIASDAGLAAALLEEVASDQPGDSVERLADLVAQLRETKARHQSLFVAARDIVARAARLFAEEASLRVHAYQRASS